jgi:hypothetical protein
VKRREFITLPGSAVILPHAAHAQERAMPVIDREFAFEQLPASPLTVGTG